MNENKPHYAVTDITPAMAAEWLDHNTHNRNLRPRVVNAYATDMSEGRWAEDGQAIKRAADGTLLDGQHRLAAIVKSGATIRMLVVSNLPHSTQETMDTGAKRTLGDVLKLRGEKSASCLAAALLRAHQWKKGYRKTVAANNDVRPTNRQLLDTLAEHPELRESVAVALRTRNHVRASAAPLSLCHWLFARIDAQDCDFFFARLSDGVGLLSTDAVYALRRTLDLNDRGTGAKYGEVQTIALVIKAWNAYRMDQPVKLLAYRPGGSNKESFPEPK